MLTYQCLSGDYSLSGFYSVLKFGFVRGSELGFALFGSKVMFGPCAIISGVVPCQSLAPKFASVEFPRAWPVRMRSRCKKGDLQPAYH